MVIHFLSEPSESVLILWYDQGKSDLAILQFGYTHMPASKRKYSTACLEQRMTAPGQAPRATGAKDFTDLRLSITPLDAYNE